MSRADYVKTTEIPQSLRCSICMEVFETPKRLQCGHTFCKTCIDQCLKSDIQKRCPFDRIPVKKINNDLY